MNYHKAKRIAALTLSAFLYITALCCVTITAKAAPASDTTDYQALAEERKSLPIQSNQIENWPEGPAIGAQSAILMEANTGAILYAKNIHEKAYPASTTKLMTCLIVAENAALDEMVSFSHDAVFSLESGSSNIGIDAGQSMPMEECLYGILVASANEVANAVAEHVAGSMDAFTDMMNEKAKELGCENTHFSNAHGLYADDHYTSAYDLALIAQAFFQNELLSKIGNTPSYHFVATATQPDDFIQRNKHQLITGQVPYEGIKGGKTGYTDEARQTLVTCAEKNGMKLICVVMKEESPDQFHDTVRLFDYGFSNFTATNVAQNETEYSVKKTDFFQTSYDVFGNSKPILSLNPNSYIILPKTVEFNELDSEISYQEIEGDRMADIQYSYHDTYLGSASIDLLKEKTTVYDLQNQLLSDVELLPEPPAQKVIFINVKIVLLIVILAAVLLSTAFVIRDIITNYNFLDNIKSRRAGRRRRRNRKNSKKGPTLPSSGFNGFGL